MGRLVLTSLFSEFVIGLFKLECWPTPIQTPYWKTPTKGTAFSAAKASICSMELRQVSSKSKNGTDRLGSLVTFAATLAQKALKIEGDHLLKQWLKIGTPQVKHQKVERSASGWAFGPTGLCLWNLCGRPSLCLGCPEAG